MEITIDSLIRDDLIDDEYKYLRLLEFHKGFIQGVKEIRKDFGILVSKTGELMIGSASIDMDNAVLGKKVARLISKQEIPDIFIRCLKSFIICSQIKVATKPIYVFNPDLQLNRELLHNKQVWPKGEDHPDNPKERAEYLESWYNHNQSLAKKYGFHAFLPVIVITKPFNKRGEFNKAVTQLWKDQIKPAIEDYKKSVPYLAEISHIPINKVEYYIKLLRLRLNEEKTHGEIAESLHITEESVREKYSKIANFLQNIGFPSLKL